MIKWEQFPRNKQKVPFRQKRLPCRSVSDCSRLLNCLYRKQSEKYSAKWDQGLRTKFRVVARSINGNPSARPEANCHIGTCTSSSLSGWTERTGINQLLFNKHFGKWIEMWTITEDLIHSLKIVCVSYNSIQLKY